MAAQCDLRDPGWGDPGFPQCALLVPSPPVAIWCLCFVGLVCFALMASVARGTQDVIATNISRRVAIPLACFALFAVFVCCWFLFLCVFCFCVVGFAFGFVFCS